MRAAGQGVYCAPLRLLAMEVADACNADGTFCSLITGTLPLDTVLHYSTCPILLPQCNECRAARMSRWL